MVSKRRISVGRRATVALGLLAALFAPTLGTGARAQTEDGDAVAAPIIGVRTDASTWRVLEGDGVVGVMGLGPFLYLGEPDPVTDTAPDAPPRVGYFAIYVEDRGVFEGVYNLKEGGRSVVGAFWPDGQAETEVVAGFLDLDSLDAPAAYGGAGAVTFTDDGASFAVSAR